VALHAGLRADQEARFIQGPLPCASWAMRVSDLSFAEATEILQRFNLANVSHLVVERARYHAKCIV
jgi:hypothetical protein